MRRWREGKAHEAPCNSSKISPPVFKAERESPDLALCCAPLVLCSRITKLGYLNPHPAPTIADYGYALLRFGKYLHFTMFMDFSEDNEIFFPRTSKLGGVFEIHATASHKRCSI
jgi:hypothetical protein